MDLALAVNKVLQFLSGPLRGQLAEKSNRLWASQSRKWPVAVDLEEDVRIIWANTPPWVSFTAFVPGLTTPDELHPPMGTALDLFQWAVTEHDGIPSGLSTTRIDIRSMAPAEVIFDSVRVHCKEFDPGPGINVVQPVGGASLESRRFDIELSGWAPQAIAREKGGAPVCEFAATISRNEPLRVNLDARVSPQVTVAKGFQWWIDADFLIEGMRKSVRIPRDLESYFALVNKAQYPTYHWSAGKWERSH